MDTKQQTSGHQVAVLERTVDTPQRDTATVEHSKPIDGPIDRPGGHRRTVGVALAAIVLAGAGGLFAVRAVDGFSEPISSVDTSHDTAEHQRHLSVKPADDVNQLDSFDLADYVWRQRQTAVDSFDEAEYARMQRQTSQNGRAQNPDFDSQVQFDPGPSWQPNQSALEQQLETNPEADFAGIQRPQWQPDYGRLGTYLGTEQVPNIR